jgi:hypothetical protein
VDLPHRALQRLLGSTKSILRLHIDPSFRTSAQPLTEPHGHFSTYSSFAIEYTRKRDTRHAESHCGIGYRDQTIREDPILEHLSGMWGIVHSRHSQLLVVVLIVDQYRILLLELKREPPVSAHCHWPVSGKIAGKLMQFPARQVHAVWTNWGVYCRKLKTKALRVGRLYARFVAGSKKSFKPLVPKRYDHQSNCIA